MASAGFSPDGRRIVTASWDTTARVWDARSGATLAVLQGHENRVDGATFSPDGRRVITVPRDKAARLWSVEIGASARSDSEGPLAEVESLVAYATLVRTRGLTEPEKAEAFLIDVQPAKATAPAADRHPVAVAVPSDPVELAAWVDRVAASGDPREHGRLGERYETGDGVPKDLGRALYHYAIAANLFDTAAGGAALEQAAEARVRRGAVARRLKVNQVVAIAREVGAWRAPGQRQGAVP